MWMIAGPRKSGSTFHKDPNASSAWNALIYGLKAWIMYPPHTVPPGVIVSGDGSSVATPVSVMEWYLDHFPSHKARCKGEEVGGGGPVCGLQYPGDVVFIPAGWWHQVLNIEDSLALTHNFISPRIVCGALRLFRDDPAAISGLPAARQTLVYPALRDALLKSGRPELIAAILAEFKEVTPTLPPISSNCLSHPDGDDSQAQAQAQGENRRQPWSTLTSQSKGAQPFVFSFKE